MPTTTANVWGESTVYPTLAEVQKQLREAKEANPEPEVSYGAVASLRHNKWPAASELKRFYGEIEYGPNGLPTQRWQADKLTDFCLPFPMRLANKLDQRVTHIRCHVEVKASLSRIFECIWNEVDRDLDTAQLLGLDLFGGCYGSYSAQNKGAIYGASIVINPDRNKAMLMRPAKVTEAICTLPQTVIQFFKDEGWHFQGDNPKNANFAIFEALT